LRIASKYAGGSDDECAIGEFGLCFQQLTGKILSSKDLGTAQLNVITASASTMMRQIAVRGKVTYRAMLNVTGAKAVETHKM
jgi:hypothetical protein